MVDLLNNFEEQNEAMFNDIDPDNNILNNMYSNFQSNTKSSYFTVNNYNSSFRNHSNYFSIIHQNIRSIGRKIDDLSQFIQSLCKQPDILVISETWLDDTSKIYCNIDSYNSHHTVRKGRAGGGVSVFVKSNIDSCCITELCMCDDSIESCVVKIKYDRDIYFITGIYRPHSDSIENFTLKLTNLLENPILRTNNIIMIGDFNINLLLNSCHHCEHFVNELHSLNFIPLITKPTRFHNPSTVNEPIQPSLLDHIWLNVFNCNSSGIILTDMSDHLAVFVHISILHLLPEKIKLEFRCHGPLYIEKFRNVLMGSDWSGLIGSVDERTNKFSCTINEQYCNTFPVKIKYLSKKRLEKPWLSNGIMNSIRRKSSLLKNLKLGLVALETYKNYCNKLKSIIRNAKKHYFSRAFSNFDNNIKQSWKIINNLICKQKKSSYIEKVIVGDAEITDETEIATHFNEYFSNIASSLDDAIPQCTSQPADSVKFNHSNSFYCSPTNSKEILDIILKLKRSRSDINVMPVYILQKVADLVSAPISSLVNYSFANGLFPSSLKVASILPIFKNGDRSVIANYRPISILPTLSKIFEKCMVRRLNGYVDKFSIISVNQFGFRKKSSTIHALEAFTDLIFNSFDSKLFNISLFIDLRKAFDTVNHKILLQKLERYGIRGPTLEWIESYVKDRRQLVRIGESSSQENVVNIGVPQGSSLSPLLFLLYINDLENVTKLFNVILFADDTTLSASDSNFSQL